MLKPGPGAVSIVPPKTKAGRTELKVLDEFVETLRLWSSQPTEPGKVRFPHAEVAVLPWTARAIHRFCNAPQPTVGETDDLVTQGVAMIAKCRTDLKAVGCGSDDLNVVYARQAELMLDAAVGSVIIRELQQLGNTLLARGENEEVKELNHFQHEVRATVMEVRARLSEEERQRAAEVAGTIAGETEVPLPSPAAPDSALRDAPARPGRPMAPAVRRPKATAAPQPADSTVVFLDEEPTPSRFRSRLMNLVLIVLAVGLVAYGISSMRTTPIEGDASDSLTASVGRMPGVTEVNDRMPYIVVTVRDEFWSDFDRSTAEGWIKELSKVTERHGYSGLVIRSTGGSPLAEWVRGRGVKFPQDPTP